MMQRTVATGDGTYGTVSLHEPVLRYVDNPILTRHHVNDAWREPQQQVVTVHNAGACAVGGQTVLLFRAHLRCGISVVGLARSLDGIHGWTVAPRPVLLPATNVDEFGAHTERAQIVAMESGGVEDARINVVEGTYAITYSAYHAHVKNRVQVALATTEHFTHITRHGPLLAQDMRNVVIFPERLDGRYVGLFRPNDTTPGDTEGAYTQIRIGFADDLRTGPWDIDAEPIMRTGGGPSAFSDKIGPGAPPVKTRHGWLDLFHGVRTTMDGNPYVLGVALHELDDPRKVKMSSIPILFPSRADCRVADTDYVHVPNVVFSCGMLRRDDGSMVIYYAGNDTVMNIAFSHEDVLAELCRLYGQDSRSGRLGYVPWPKPSESHR
jgi:predicted GH43/DUF377 family glycosyl hydrolase